MNCPSNSHHSLLQYCPVVDIETFTELMIRWLSGAKQNVSNPFKPLELLAEKPASKAGVLDLAQSLEQSSKQNLSCTVYIYMYNLLHIWVYLRNTNYKGIEQASMTMFFLEETDSASFVLFCTHWSSRRILQVHSVMVEIPKLEPCCWLVSLTLGRVG